MADHGLVAEMHEIESSAGGMPQLDPSSFSSQLFWLGITFVILYVVMARSVIPRIREVLEKRQNQIQHDLDTAEKSKTQAETAKLNYEEEVIQAKEKSSQLIQQTQREIDAMMAQEQANLTTQLEELLADSDRTITEQRQAAREAIAPVLVDITMDVVEKLIQVKPAPSKVTDTLHKAMRD